MNAPSSSPRQTPAASSGPGRPKDPAKRAAILEAARQMFTEHGFGDTSMDQIAAAAGVSKLTVYSHFGDKQKLFASVVRSYCDQSLPTTLFEPSPETPLRERMLQIAQAFFSLVASPQAVAGHRVMCNPKVADPQMPKMFWDAGPGRVQRDFAQLLQRRIDAGQLAPHDTERAASQFFALVKGELHQLMVLGCDAPCESVVQAHLEASVDMFLRAYGTEREPSA